MCSACARKISKITDWPSVFSACFCRAEGTGDFRGSTLRPPFCALCPDLRFAPVGSVLATHPECRSLNRHPPQVAGFRMMVRKTEWLLLLKKTLKSSALFFILVLILDLRFKELIGDSGVKGRAGSMWGKVPRSQGTLPRSSRVSRASPAPPWAGSEVRGDSCPPTIRHRIGWAWGGCPEPPS